MLTIRSDSDRQTDIAIFTRLLMLSENIYSLRGLSVWHTVIIPFYPTASRYKNPSQVCFLLFFQLFAFSSCPKWAKDEGRWTPKCDERGGMRRRWNAKAKHEGKLSQRDWQMDQLQSEMSPRERQRQTKWEKVFILWEGNVIEEWMHVELELRIIQITSSCRKCCKPFK